jgi:ABC-type nickel/cobalt efflux system permease component RcnA
LLVALCIFPLFYSTANPFLSGTDVNTETQGEEQIQLSPVRPPSSPVLRTVSELQLKLKNTIGEVFVPSEDATFRMRFLLLLVSTLYGIVHAIGPGHRKTIIFTLFLTQPTKRWESAAAGFLAAGAHGGTGIVLILLLRLLTPKSVLQGSERFSLILEGATYLALALVAIILFIKVTRDFIKGGHKHSAGSSKGIYLTLLSSSLFPCPGAVLILLFSLSLGEIFWGIMAVLALSFGMGITITVIAVLARTGREELFNRLSQHGKLAARIGAAFEGGAYLFLLAFSLWMASPFLVSLFSAAT